LFAPAEGPSYAPDDIPRIRLSSAIRSAFVSYPKKTRGFGEVRTGSAGGTPHLAMATSPPPPRPYWNCISKGFDREKSA